MCFDKTILMAELEGRLPYIGGLFLPTTPSILDTFTRYLVRTFKKVCSTSVVKIFRYSSFYFWNYDKPISS